MKRKLKGFWLKMPDGTWVHVLGDPEDDKLAKNVVLMYEAAKKESAKEQRNNE